MKAIDELRQIWIDVVQAENAIRQRKIDKIESELKQKRANNVALFAGMFAALGLEGIEVNDIGVQIDDYTIGLLDISEIDTPIKKVRNFRLFIKRDLSPIEQAYVPIPGETMATAAWQANYLPFIEVTIPIIAFSLGSSSGIFENQVEGQRIFSEALYRLDRKYEIFKENVEREEARKASMPPLPSDIQRAVDYLEGSIKMWRNNPEQINARDRMIIAGINWSLEL